MVPMEAGEDLCLNDAVFDECISLVLAKQALEARARYPCAKW